MPIPKIQENEKIFLINYISVIFILKLSDIESILEIAAKK